MEYFTTSDLKNRGWTKSLIEELNLQPDLEKQNPKFPSAAPMKLYRTQKIYDLERTEQFQAVQSKNEIEINPELLEYVQNVELEFDDLPYELTHLALDSYNAWLLNRPAVISGRKPFIEVGIEEIDTVFLEKIKGNYVRHCLSNYEHILGFVQAHDCGFEEFRELKKILKGRFDREISDMLGR